jgi:hypothetical protein
MRVTLDSADARSVARIAEALRVSARAHKQAIRTHREALKLVLDAVSELEKMQNGEAGDKHGQ